MPAGGRAPRVAFVVKASNASATLNGQPSAIPALQPSDVVDLVMDAGSSAPATTSQFAQTMTTAAQQAGGAAAGSAIRVIATRNTVTGTSTSTSTTATTLPVKGLPWPSTTVTMQPASGNAVTPATDDSFPCSQMASLQTTPSSVTLALDSDGPSWPSSRRARPRFLWP